MATVGIATRLIRIIIYKVDTTMSTNDFYRKLIKPIRDPYIDDLINKADSSIYSPYDKELNWEERTTPINLLKTKFLEWSKDWVSGLDQFSYVYVMNGNTDSLNTIFSKSDNGMAWHGKR